MYYEIRVKGIMTQSIEKMFLPLQCTFSDRETRIKGQLKDQSDLFGVLKKIRDLNIVLISVNQIEKGV